MPRRVLDTNVLVYTDDATDKRRARLAVTIVQQALRDGGALSTQVLQEYYSVTTRKLGTDAAVARRKVEVFASIDVVQIDGLDEAVDDGEPHRGPIAQGLWRDDDADEEDTSEADSELVAWCDDILSWNSGWVALENDVLTLVNQRRATGAVCGGVSKPAVPALSLDTRLRCAARKHSKDMVVKNFFSHTGSNGWTPWQRITAAGYVYTNAAENIAAGQTTALAVVNGWMASTGHCNNIMNGVLRDIGVAYYPGGTYGHYWTQDFGKQ